MEFGSRPQNDSSDPKSLRSAQQIVAPCSRPSLKLRDILVSDKPTMSYADFHHEITRNTTSALPNTFREQQSRGVQGWTNEDEMVRHMSDAPNYLEKGKDFQEKVLNVGVLHWRPLEKWKHSNNPIPCRNSGCPSTSTTYFTADGSSSCSSRGHISSPARPRLHHSSLQSHLEASPRKTHSLRDKSHGGRGHSCSPARQRTYHLVPQSYHPKAYPSEGQSVNAQLLSGHARKYEEVSSSIAYNMIRLQKQYEIDHAYRECQSEVRTESCERRECDASTGSETVKTQGSSICDVASSPLMRKMMIRESELTKEVLQSKDQNLNDAGPDCPGRCKRVILLMPRDSKSQFLNPSAAGHTKEDPGRKAFSEKHEYNEAGGWGGLKADVPYAEVRDSCSMDRQGVKVFSRSVRSASNPSRGKSIEEKKPIVVLKCSGELKLSGELEKKAGMESATKTRHPSPIRRLSSAVGSVIRSVGSRENSPIRRSSSREAVVKPGMDKTVTSASSFDSTDKQHESNNRSRSSPLRRLLNPLLKPKAPGEPLKKESTSMSGPWKSSNEWLQLLREQPTKVKSKVIDGRAMSWNGSHQNPRRGSVKHQALLQVAVKNGLPLFTFAVDNSSDILAATLRKGKNRPSRIYTFFTVQEIEKKNGTWLNQASKGNNSNQGFIPNVVAQMKVLNPQSPAVTRHKDSVNDDTVREFCLFSVDVGQMDQHATEFQPTNELAAIIVRHVDSSLFGPRNCLPESRHSDCGDGLQDGNALVDSHGLSTTVILPGGVHTIPSEGSISTLTQRWRSGGTCDCGGWDLGCQLRVFTNQGKLEKASNSSKAISGADEFKLFKQVGQENQLVLSLSPFKERIHSVEFDSSITLLQAFAISVSVLDCRGSPPMEMASDDQAQGGAAPAPASYVSYPPHSPVGRA